MLRTTLNLFYRTFLLTLFFFSGFSVFAQNPEFKVKSFTHEQNRLLARINTNMRLDDNDEPCALILVRTAETGLGFAASSGIVGDVEWKNGEYWVYVSGGNRTLKMFKKGIKATEYIFEIILQSSETYLLDLEVERPEPIIAEWPVTIITQPDNANMIIDGNAVNRQSKTVKLTEGTHALSLEMPGYEKLEKTIEVDENNVYFNFELPKITGVPLMIESDPAGATVYLEGVKLGETPFSVFYPPGTYQVKVEKDGFIIIENQTLTIATPQTKKTFTLEENVGFITVNTFETAKVFINNTEYPEHQNIKLQPQLLTIKVTMPKAADKEQQIVLKRNDQLTIDIFPDAATGTIQVAVTPFDATKTETITLTANGVIDKNIKLEKVPSGDIEMVFVKGGTFTMGCTSEQSDCGDDEKPTHEVSVSDFYMGKYEVTQKQWLEIIGNNPSHFKNCDDCPVEQVSWNDVQEFIKKLNANTGLHYRLPTEAELEYAASGGSLSPAGGGAGGGFKYAGSNNIYEVAWYEDNSSKKTHPVGQKQPNELGIYDMSGNVWEWCSDWYGENYYENSPRNNPQGPSSGSYRVWRGGGWYSNSWSCRVASRIRIAPGDRGSCLGFRLVLVP
ncbi:MAG: hypothetical protein B6D61_11505 [Bacteroidetes bacterium 4484_249]|nr:MAG: hypothetical protein B6D61_11505 [Bacteroidetes bacterium 4484_249]